MTVVLFIIGIFLLWQGQMQLSKKNPPWPKEKKNGRIIGAILLLLLIIEYLLILLRS
jgi:hypothetical protein